MFTLPRIAKQATTTLSILAVAGGMTAAAQAVTFTEILPTPHAEERNIDEILGAVYGGTFTLVDGKNFANEFGVVAERVPDMNAEGNDDRFWPGDLYATEAKARFADFDQAFGFFPNSSGGSYNPLFEVTGYGFDVTGAATVDLTHLETLRWSRSGDQGGTWTSNPQDNGLHMNDHLVTYKMMGLTGERFALTKNTWILFWEDLDLGDQDYNDLVVEVRSIIPEPVTATLFAMGVSSLVFSIRRRR